MRGKRLAPPDGPRVVMFFALAIRVSAGGPSERGAKREWGETPRLCPQL
jgi:hypothetical protein